MIGRDGARRNHALPALEEVAGATPCSPSPPEEERVGVRRNQALPALEEAAAEAG